MTTEQKEWIGNATYEQLLSKWRLAPAGDPYFRRGETFEYYVRVMRDKKAANLAEHVRASKAIGWN